MFESSKLSRYKIRKLIECFCIDIDATKTALLLKLNRKTVNRFFLAFRRLIHSSQLSSKAHMNFPVPARDPGESEDARGASKHLLFGMYVRDGAIYTEPISGSLTKTCRALLKGKLSPEQAVQTEGWPGYDGLVDVGHDKYLRIGKTEKSVKIDAIEAYWSFVKRRLAKFNGANRHFDLHLKECEWRYNRSLPQLLADIQHLIAHNKEQMAHEDDLDGLGAKS